MINPDYYIPQNVVSTYMGGKIKHYMKRPPAVVLQSYPYVIGERETMYTLGKNVFGATAMYLWTIIADTNKLKQPDEWLPGEVIKLPEIILNNLQITEPKYESATTLTTVL